MMVGEIRNGETARIAVESAMTGHLVLSTLHTNSAIGAVSRLVDMGVDRFLLAPMLRGLVAQRLVRRLRPDCTRPHTATEADAHLLSGALALGEEIRVPGGCDACAGQGYRERLPLYGLIEVEQGLEKPVHEDASDSDLVRAARARGPGILHDAAGKLRAGRTSVEEVARAVRDNLFAPEPV